MHTDELCSAVKRIVDLLNKADILSAVRQYRAAKDGERAVAAARLSHAGAVIVEGTGNLNGAERAVVQCMHLESLSSSSYWDGLLQASAEPRQAAAELVHLYSRVMFATSHLPNLAALLDTGAGTVASDAMSADPPSSSRFLSVEPGERRLHIRLTDAGERASDPDRIARTVDGIDMLYSACASIVRKPAMDLRLDGIDGGEERNIRFTGELDSITAVSEVISSIPDALSRFDDSEDIDLNELIGSLPVFDALKRLAEQGHFSGTDLHDISETMHQGVLLVLESGVILVQDEDVAEGAETYAPTIPVVPAGPSRSSHMPPAASRRDANRASTASCNDENYQRYLAEREALLGRESTATPPSVADEQRRQEAVDSLLKSLGQARSA